MGRQRKQPRLWSYNVNLDRRVRADQPLRQVERLVDFVTDGEKLLVDASFARADSSRNSIKELPDATPSRFSLYRATRR